MKSYKFIKSICTLSWYCFLYVSSQRWKSSAVFKYYHISVCLFILNFYLRWNAYFRTKRCGVIQRRKRKKSEATAKYFEVAEHLKKEEADRSSVKWLHFKWESRTSKR